MTDKDKIRAEIERRRALNFKRKQGSRSLEDNDILSFIDSMQEDSVSEDWEEAGKEWLRPQLDKTYANYGETKMMELTHFDGYAMLDAIEFGAQLQKRRIMKEIKSRLVDAATNQDNSADIGEQTYYHGMVDALGRLRDKFMED